ncbi:hypothetical protein [Mariniphaga sp.]|uniref:hypothetical protein n=1 Tax=Mariniphaga sp. TaxID=1954475 RepID=UPI0035630473
MKIKLKILLLVIVAAFMASSCLYDWEIPEEIPDRDPDQEISFSEEVLPIFTSGNNCTACHNGSQIPDLREENAFSSLNSTRYINKTSPEESRIYTYPHPDGEHYKKYTLTQADLILAWIEQGAKNN